MPRGVYPRQHRDEKQHFFSRVTIGDGCWEWIGFRDGHGRCRTNSNGKYSLAHRFSFETWIGSIPDGMLVCHRCDNPSCARPSHLFLGTNQDNSLDMAKKGRSALQRYHDLTLGEKNPSAKLTWRQVEEIRAAPAGYGKIKALAEKYGVTTDAIYKIRSGQNWMKRPAS